MSKETPRVSYKKFINRNVYTTVSTLDISFILVRPKYSGNIGYVARVIKNFGFNKLILINPLAEINQESKILSVHAVDVLERVKIYKTLEEGIEKEKINYLIGTTARLGSEKNPLRTVMPSNMLRDLSIPDSHIGILFGNEESGLTNEELSLCDMVVTIPTSSDYPVLNLSHAVAIIAYEFSLLLNKSRPMHHRPSLPRERKVLLHFMNNVLDMLDIPEYKKRIYKGILKNLVGRSFITGREVHSLIGIFKKIDQILMKCANVNISDKSLMNPH